MTTAYVDASALMKLIVREPESAAIRALLVSGERELVASMLLHAEMLCASGRRPDIIQPQLVTAALDLVALAELSRSDLIAAGTHAPLRTGDAIHLATAVRLGVDVMITYDTELARAAADVGISVLSPA